MAGGGAAKRGSNPGSRTMSVLQVVEERYLAALPVPGSAPCRWFKE